MSWEQLYRQLESLPYDADEWDEIEGWLDRIYALFEKRQRRLNDLRQRLEQSLEELKEDCAEVLRYFQFDKVFGWSAARCPVTQWVSIAELVKELATQLAAYRACQAKMPGTLGEARKQREEMAALEAKISALYEGLATTFDVSPSGTGSLGEMPETVRQEAAMTLPSLEPGAEVYSSAGSSGFSAAPAAVTQPQELAERQPRERSETTPGIQVLSPVAVDTKDMVVEDDVVQQEKVEVSLVSDEHAEVGELPQSTPHLVVPSSESEVGAGGMATASTSVGEVRGLVESVTDDEGPILPAPNTVQTPEPATIVPIAPPSPFAYRFGPEQSAAQVASEILRMAPNEWAPLLPSLIWRLMQEDRMGFAYFLAHWLQQEEGTKIPHVPAWLVRACTTGIHVCNPVGSMAMLLRDDFARLDEGVFAVSDENWDRALQLMLAAAALRPALLAPVTGASAVLHRVHRSPGLEELYDYCRQIIGFSELGQPLDPATLKNIKTQAAWQQQLDALYAELETWYSRAPTMTMAYAAASRIWQQWLRPDGLIYELLKHIRDKDADRKDDVRREANRLSDPAVVAREVQRADRGVRERRREPITATALAQMQARVREAVTIARRWVALLDSNPSSQRRFVQRQVEKLREDLAARHDRVLSELDEFAKRRNIPMIAAAIARCQATVKSVRLLFDPAKPFDQEEPDVRHLIQVDLLRVGGIPLDEEWKPISGVNEQIVKQMLDYLAAGQRSWKEAFDRYLELRDHEGTARVIEVLEATPQEDIDVDYLRQRRETALRECRQALRRDIDQTKAQIEQAVAFGLLREKERTDYARTVEQIELGVDETSRFDECHKRLREVRDKIDAQEKQAVEEVSRRLKESNLDSTHPAYSRIKLAIESRDYFTANEYLDMAIRGEQLPAAEMRRDALRDFLECFSGIEEYLSAKDSWQGGGPNRIIGDIRDGKCLGPVSLSHVPGAQANQAAQMVKVWLSAKRQEDIDQHGVETILQSLGFTVLSVAKRKSANRVWFDVSTQVLMDRDFCAVPGYGSQADGRYRVLCVWHRPTEEDLLMMVGPTGHTEAVIVFHFGRMSLLRRRDLARLCRERRRTCLVLDDTLLIFLCGERGSRLPVLFECGLPFTFQEPYTTTAGLVPPEMFYGRRQEVDSILDPWGTCFIYGGRQLGKTALLRQVEQRHHDPKRGHLVLWLDLKTEGIGTGRTLDAIWTLLADRFKELNVLPPQTPAHINPEKLLELVAQWLHGHPQRRILLLLDEADHFLESDGEERSPNPFRRVELLKGLMDRTNRRFKVVFAGLHDVQRTSRQVNQPLAPGHTGDPVCIGPLINHGEWREARALIERPLATIGYRFESPDLVTRILSQTNYYPNLIQLYCRHLLYSLQGRHAAPFDYRQSPPYTITSQHVEEVSRNPDLRRAIRDRFDLTLNLDRRYRVIALVIALGSQGGAETEATDGFSVAWVRDQVLTYWPRGFKNAKTEEALSVLLDEMVGLGVLVKVGESRYGLRSPNLKVLMGTSEQIEAELLSCDEWPDPVEYNPATFRSVRRDTKGIPDPTRRSPLTAEQESHLRQRDNGVSILCGCKAAGLEDVAAFLEAACGAEFFELWNRVKNEDGLNTKLDALRSRERDGVTVLLVPSEVPWEISWVHIAHERVRRLTSKRAFARVVFLADPGKVWQCVSVWQKEFNRLLMELGVRKLSLSPWHEATIRQWLDDCNFGAKAQQEWGWVMAATGGWPMVLQRFLEKTSPDREDWGQQLQETSQELRAPEWKTHWRDAFGLDAMPHSKLLSGWADLGSGTVTELAEVLEAEESVLQQIIRWAELLNLAVAAGSYQWSLDPIVSSVIRGASA